MKIKSIVIELEMETGDMAKHATLLEFKDNMWQFNGPTYPRINAACSELFKQLRGRN